MNLINHYTDKCQEECLLNHCEYNSKTMFKFQKQCVAARKLLLNRDDATRFDDVPDFIVYSFFGSCTNSRTIILWLTVPCVNSRGIIVRLFAHGAVNHSIIV